MGLTGSFVVARNVSCSPQVAALGARFVTSVACGAPSPPPSHSNRQQQWESTRVALSVCQLIPLSAVSAGLCHTTATTDDGVLLTWGEGGYGQVPPRPSSGSCVPLLPLPWHSVIMPVKFVPGLSSNPRSRHCFPFPRRGGRASLARSLLPPKRSWATATCPTRSCRGRWRRSQGNGSWPPRAGCGTWRRRPWTVRSGEEWVWGDTAACRPGRSFPLSGCCMSRVSVMRVDGTQMTESLSLLRRGAVDVGRGGGRPPRARRGGGRAERDADPAEKVSCWRGTKRLPTPLITAVISFCRCLHLPSPVGPPHRVRSGRLTRTRRMILSNASCAGLWAWRCRCPPAPPRATQLSPPAASSPTAP